MNRLLSFCLLVLFFCSSSHAAVSVQTVTFNGPDAVVLEGVMYQPENWANGSGFSAVVMMHGCSGIWSSKNPDAVNGNGTPNLQNHIEKWGLKLAEEGIVALAVDSFTPRKPAEADAIEWQDQCSGSTYAGMVDSYTTRVLDSRSAWDYLATNSKINGNTIALLGWSHGAQASMVEAAETDKDNDVSRQASDHRFAATVVFYPGCGSNLGFGGVNSSYWRPYRNVLMQMGDGDSFHDNCQTRFDRAGSVYGAIADSGHGVLFVSHAEAAHSFDATSQTWPADYCVDNPPVGDTCAMNKADIESLAFLQAEFLANRQVLSVVDDFDNDGDGDVLLRSGSSGQFALASMQGGAVSGAASLAIPLTWTSENWVHQANPDVDGDGDKDIVTGNSSTGAWRKIILENGAYVSQSAIWLDSGNVYAFVAVGDFDGDGDDDIVLKNNNVNTWQLNEVQSGGIVDKRNLPLYTVDYAFQAIGDFDGDGDDDVLMRRSSTG
ncbi:MAG: VCBS repeat-containing protein, partial [Pseudomonadales bacterium]|nr:VCBS repeat-containing protein [Pseudomonadales bacterium]